MEKFENPNKKKANKTVGAALGALIAGATPNAAQAGPNDAPPTTTYPHFEMTIPLTPQGVEAFKKGLEGSNKKFEEQRARDSLEWIGRDYDEEVRKSNEHIKKLKEEQERERDR